MTTKLRLLSAALLLAIAPLAASAEEKKVEFRYGMDEAGFRAANAELTGKQMFLADLSVASVHGVPTIAAIWMRWSESTPEAAAQAQKLVFLRQTPAEVQAKYMELSKAGSQLTAIDAYDVDGTTYFATAFLAPDQKPMQFVGAFLAEKDAADFRTEAQSKGMDLLRLEVAPDGDTVVYFPTYIARGETSIDGVQGDGEMQFNANRIKMDFAQMQPLSIAAYRGKSGHASFVGMFDDAQDRVLVLNEPLADFSKSVEPLLARGALTFDVDSYVEGDVVKYSAVLLQPD